MPTTTSPFTWGAFALSVALLADPAAAQLTSGSAPGRRDHTADDGGHCFHDLDLDGETCDDQARDFILRYGAVLGVPATGVNLGPVVMLPAGSARTRTYASQRQMIHGFEVEGYGVTYLIDPANRIRGARGVLARDASALPAPLVVPAAARLTALASQGLTPANFRSAPTVKGVARLIDGELRLVQRVTGVLHDFTPLAMEVDAYTGDVVRVFEHRYDGNPKTGTHTYSDIDTSFALGKGRGHAYRRVKHAISAKDTPTSLKNFAVSESTPIIADAGKIYGRFAQVFNADGVVVTSADFDYPYADDDTTLFGGSLISGADLFDHTNTYYWFDAAGTWIERELGVNPIDRVMPVYVNEDVMNAFFSPVDPDEDGAGFAPGFFLFGDFGDGPDELMHDFSRDPSIVIHEYLHGVIDGLGATFGHGSLDMPERGVNEALADFGAAAMLNDPKIGRVLGTFAGEELGLTDAYVRDLESDLTLQDNLFDILGITTALPEEHHVGELFGAYLWRASRGLKKTATETFLADMLQWPQSSAEVGFPSVTPGNAAEAYEAFLYGCVEAAIDTILADEGTAKPRLQRQAGIILAAALAHGLSGQSDASTYTFDATEGLKSGFRSEFLGSLTSHEMKITVAEGQTISIAAKGLGGMQIDVSFDDEDLTLEKPKKTNSKQTWASLPKVVATASGTYTLNVTNLDSGSGEYVLRIKVK